MAHELYEPTQPNEALEGYGIVLINHAGSTVAQDTGRDAADLRKRFGVPVLAVDRPGTGIWLRDSVLAEYLSTPAGYVAEMAGLRGAVNGTLSEAGVERSLVMGRSAGGLGALALTTAAVIESQVAVYAAEPVGCQQRTIAEGRQWYKKYGHVQDEMQATVPNLVQPNPPGLGPIAGIKRLVNMGPDNWVDRFHNGAIWASDAATRFMYGIAGTQPDTDMTVDFAETSMMVTPEQVDHLTKTIPPTRTGLHIESVPLTTHASFDNREFMADRVRLVFDRLLATS